jgi:restriction system protein
VISRFHSESRELVVHWELPRQDVIPKVVSYRYRTREKDFRAEPRKDAEIERLYRDLVARVTLRVVAEIFYATPAPLVGSVVFNGFISAGTGPPARLCGRA